MKVLAYFVIAACACGLVTERAVAEQFSYQNWTGTRLNNDAGFGCVMGKHIQNGRHFLVYANENGFAIGASHDGWSLEVDQAMKGMISFDGGETITLDGKAINSSMVLFLPKIGSVKDDTLEGMVSRSSLAFMMYFSDTSHSLSIPLDGSREAVSRLRKCTETWSKERSSASEPIGRQAPLASASGPIGEDEIHEACRLSDENREEGKKYFDLELKDRRVRIRLKAEELRREKSQLSGVSQYRLGAYFGEVSIKVDIGNVQLPQGLNKGDMVLVDGVVSQETPLHWQNLSDLCLVAIDARSVELDGF